MTPSPDTKGAQPEQLVDCPTCGAACRIGGDDKEGTHYYEPLTDDALATALSECREALDATWEDVSMLLDLHTSKEVKDSSRRSLIERFSALYAAAQPPMTYLFTSRSSRKRALSKAEQERDEACELLEEARVDTERYVTAQVREKLENSERELERLREILARFDWDAEVRAALSADTQKEDG